MRNAARIVVLLVVIGGAAFWWFKPGYIVLDVPVARHAGGGEFWWESQYSELAYADSWGVLYLHRRVGTAYPETHWRTLEEAGQALGDAGKSLTSSAHQLASNYVEVVGRVRLGSTTLTERSVIQRDDNQRVLWRERGVFAAQAVSLQ